MATTSTTKTTTADPQNLEQDNDINNDDDSSSGQDYDRPHIRQYLRALLPQMLVGFIDAIAFMIIAPSLVFYVLENGGTKEQYGIILATFSFSSFLFKPLLAYWCDSIRQFRPPYLTSIVMAGIGGLVYFIASAFSSYNPTIAVSLILLGRFLGGCGAANTTLGFTYVAHVIPPEIFTQANSLLSMVRVIGMALAPALNALLSFVHYDVTIWGTSHTLHIDPLNSVGLLLAVGNLLGYLSLWYLFEEPADMVKPSSSLNDPGQEGGWNFWRHVLLRFDIVLPLLSTLTLNANYQLLETGLAPAANDILGWEPVRISALFGVNALVIFAVIVLTFTLASWGVKDLTLMKVGLLLSVLGYTLMHVWWHRGAETWMFVTPVLVSCMVFPFLSSPTRSLFTLAVAKHPQLKHNQGTMQAILSMNISVAGFAAPGLIAAYVLRSPDEVTNSLDQREFTPWALFAPVFSALILLGVLYEQWRKPSPGSIAGAGLLDTTGDSSDLTGIEPEALTEEALDEQLSLLTGAWEPDAKMMEATRRHTLMMMGIPNISYHPYPSARQRSTTVLSYGGGSGSGGKSNGASHPSRRLDRHSSAF